ncbi:hypothetical protein FNV43_RR24670 [Rhamnella rubrinervis]|uniref:UDP-glycosyltransferases domain-containing protein n=1 Tax=Rhamnella rubrinervis TaxID=2594499 RepID=A0A8K0DQZ9_9ROSA|nr:hypothetical protein FNV43_RR24670 [Rhamnella rubrinervis]
MESFLRFRDLPSFCRASDTKDPILQGIARETRHITRGQGLILNTFEELEGPILSHIRTKYPNIYSIAPIHTHLKLKLKLKRKLANKEVSSQPFNSLFEIDRTCITWLDAQPLKSVIYVSFGSTTVMTNDQLMEFWYGLVKSKQRFLWAIRHDMVHKQGEGDDGKNNIPAELTEGTKERGYMVWWAPQEEVLEHPSVCGFVTHSGMNSILESLLAGVPMICWPYHADHQMISRCVREMWKIGLDMKDVCDRNIVEKMINDLMVERREEFQRAVDNYRRLAIKSVSEGGSSYSNLDSLIQDILKMNDKFPF